MGSPVAVYFLPFQNFFLPASLVFFYLPSAFFGPPSFLFLFSFTSFSCLHQQDVQQHQLRTNLFFLPAPCLFQLPEPLFFLTCFCQLQTASRTSSRLLPEPVILLFCAQPLLPIRSRSATDSHPTCSCAYCCSGPVRTYLYSDVATNPLPRCGRHAAARTAAVSPRAPICARPLPPIRSRTATGTQLRARLQWACATSFVLSRCHQSAAALQPTCSRVRCCSEPARTYLCPAAATDPQPRCNRHAAE